MIWLVENVGRLGQLLRTAVLAGGAVGVFQPYQSFARGFVCSKAFVNEVVPDWKCL